ncbi:MAG: DEAD/DEAH box helicase [Bdellovibrionota bacterium]
MEILSLLSELEESSKANLLAFVDGELSREYASKHKNKALKLSADALIDCRISGERITANLREGGKSFRVDMTFPLFDLDNDYTLVVCSCQRESLSLETQRCHHMYYFQDRIRTALVTLAQAAPADPLAGLDQILAEDDQSFDDRYLREFRWRYVFDPIRFSLHFEKEARDRYEPDSLWKWVENASLDDWLKRLGKPSERSEVALFDVLTEAREDGVAISDGHRSINLEAGQWSFQIDDTEEGLFVKPALAQTYIRVDGRGLIYWFERTATLQLLPLTPKEEHFLTYILRMDKPFPVSHKERVLEMLSRMDTAVFRLAKDEGPMEAARYQSILRLTPFKRGGMRIEIRLQLEAGLSLKAGEGEERIARLSKIGVWQRDLRVERKRVDELIDHLRLDGLPQPEPGFWIAFNDGKALECVARIEELKGKLDFVVEWPSFLAKKSYEFAAPLQAKNLKVSVGEKKDWLEVEGFLELDDGHRLSLRELIKNLKRKNNYMQLADGRWSLIPEHFRDKLQPLSEAIELDDDSDKMSLDMAALNDESRLQAIEEFPFQESSKKFWSLVARARHSQGLAIPLPGGLKADLRPYQKEGFRWLARLSEWGLGACLADDMGLGKTLQTLAVLLYRAPKGPSLVVAPSSLAYNWQSEARKFTPDLNVIQLRELSSRGVGQSFQPGDVVIASYGMIMRYAENLSDIQWNVVVLDEAQTIKNAQTKTAQAVQLLKSDWSVALSGTPIENHLGDLWSLFRTLSPGLFGEWERFRRSYVFPIERENSQAAKDRLKNKIAPFVLRRMKKDYLTELPEKTEIDLWVELSSDEKDLYDALRGQAIDQVQSLTEEDPEAQTQMQILAALTRLRQASCHRALIDETYVGSSSKLDVLRERLEELREASHCALVFSQFTRFLKIIHLDLQKLGFRVLYLDGSTPVKERLRLVEQFQAGDYDVFLISLKAGGTGLNLTRANYVFHLDPWWNPAAENQASDRAYRMGQKNAVTVYRLRSKGTIEEMIHAMHGEKKALVEAVLEGKTAEDPIRWKDLWNALWPKGEASRKKPSSFKTADEGFI